MAIVKSFQINGQSLVRDVFIETGSFKGDTVIAALNAGFKRVKTIEVDFKLYSEVNNRFYNELRVTPYWGTSPDVLKKIIDPSQSTTIYLDGHFSGNDETALDSAYGECPLLEELKVITGYQWTTPPIIVIDDLQMFKRPWNEDLLARFKQDHWPTLDQIFSLVPDRCSLETEYELYFL